MKCALLAGCLLGAALSNVPASSCLDGSYAEYWGRADALLPGMTRLAEDLAVAGEWEIVGGRRVEAPGAAGIAATADGGTLAFIWKGGLAREYPLLTIGLNLAAELPAPAQVLFYLYADGEFKTEKGAKRVQINAGNPTNLTFHIPPSRGARRYGAAGAGLVDGFKIEFTGSNLAGQTVALHGPRLTAEYFEGFFRRNIFIPEGAVWEAVAEVGSYSEFYVNGKLVEDESIVLPRPVNTGPEMYGSRRISLKNHIQTGKNTLGLHVKRFGSAPAAYLCGSVIMADGQRIPLDSGTNWIWNRVAPDNWPAPGYNDAGWMQVKNQSEMPREHGLGSYYKGDAAVACPMANIGLSYRPRGNLPCYDGLIRLCNPADNKLFFNEDKDFLLEIWIPPGFKDKQPELAWEIQRYHPDGTFEEAAQGKVVKFDLAESQTEGVSEAPVKSLVGKINSVRLPRGIYVLTSRLRVNGEVIEERDPEALVVTGRVRMEKVAGDTLEQGLDLALEQTIDFTDPADPHPWFETDHKGPIPAGRWGSNYYHTVEPALIVERNGLKYRTTRPVDWAQFSYQVEFGHPGDWYLLALEYPDDAERWIGVSCNAGRTPEHLRRAKPEEQYSASSKCGPAIWTGGKYPNTGRMLEMQWLYRPDPGGHAINVMSLMKDTAAAAAKLKIYHVKGRLPELDAGAITPAGQRRFGMVTERTYPWASGIYNLFSSFDSRQVALRGDKGAGQYTNNAIVDWCEHLRLLEDAASHYAEYMRFAGQNLHAMGCFQYGDDNTASQYITGDLRIHDSSKNMLARVLAANDLMFYASVEFICTERLGRRELDPEWYFADRAGNRAIRLWANKPLNLNFLHPAVESEMLELARQLAECFQHQPNFLGINWTAYFSGFWIPSYRNYSHPYNDEVDPLETGYDDFTVGLFEKDTGIKIPVAGANRAPSIYEQRYQFLTSAQMKPVWLNWRARKMAEFFAKVNRTIGKVRPGLETVAGCYLNFEHVCEWHKRQITVADYLDLFGWNPASFQEHERVWLMPWLPLAGRYQPASRAENYAMSWQWNKDPGFYSVFAGQARRAIMFHAGWIEVERVAANYPCRAGWPRPYQQTMMAQQREEMALEPYTQAMIGMDPQMVMMGFTDQTPYIGVEEIQRKFTRVLRRLPWGRFEPVLSTGFDSNFAIRALRAGDDYLFYIANPGYWPVAGAVTLANAGEVFDLVSGKSVPVLDGVIRVALEPFGIAAFRACNTGAGTPSSRSPITIAAWQTDPVPASELAHMQRILSRAQAEAGKPGGVAGFLGAEDYLVFSNAMQMAEAALAEKRYAAAWAALSDARFWSILFEQMPRMPDNLTDALALNVRHVGGGYIPKVDGIFNDRIWKSNLIDYTGPFVGQDGRYPAARTIARAGKPGHVLCFAVACHDPTPERIKAGASEPDGRALWRSGDDMLVITIMPDDKQVYQFAVNAAGTKSARQIGGPANKAFNPAWEAAVVKCDWGWQAEIVIEPRKSFGGLMQVGGQWRINLHRLFRPDMAVPASWTYTADWQLGDRMGLINFKPYR